MFQSSSIIYVSMESQEKQAHALQDIVDFCYASYPDVFSQALILYEILLSFLNFFLRKLKMAKKADTVVKVTTGRFKCRFPGCSRTYYVDGKRRREKTHGMTVTDTKENVDHALQDFYQKRNNRNHVTRKF